MKKLLACLSLVLVMGISGAALAQQNNDPAALDPLWREHRQSMAAIQDKLMAKSMEYEALVANPNSKPADVTAVIEEITKLRGQMRSEYDKFASQMNDQGYGPGYGPGPGYGMGGGYGMGYGCGGWGGGGRGYGRNWGGHRGGGRGYHHGW